MGGDIRPKSVQFSAFVISPLQGTCVCTNNIRHLFVNTYIYDIHIHVLRVCVYMNLDINEISHLLSLSPSYIESLSIGEAHVPSNTVRDGGGCLGLILHCRDAVGPA